MIRIFACVIWLALLALPAGAAPREAVTQLIEAMRFDETVEIIRQEGHAYGETLAEEMLPNADPEGWKAVVARIYDSDKMRALLTKQFDAALQDTDIAPLLAFYTSPDGQQVVALELAARRSFLDPDIEEAAQRRYQQMAGSGAPIIAMIETLIADSDMIESNVTGALNSNLMFYRGLSDGGAFEMSEADILADVWAQEQEVRDESETWLYSFLLMAYQPLDPEILEEYAALYRTPEGRDLNRALFGAFNEMYDEISYLLGQGVAQYSTSEKL